jgi:hypothetical protein
MDLYKQEKEAHGIYDLIQLRGAFEIALHNAETGEELERVKVFNTVVTSGRSYVLSMIQSTAPATATFNSIAVGTSTTAPTTGDTLLGSEALRIAIASWVTTGLTANPPSWQAQCTFATNQANTTLGEAGIFNQAGSNVQTMLSHVTFATINKTTSNTLAISYTISN